MTRSEAAADRALVRLADVLAGVRANTADYCGHCYGEQDAVALEGPVDAIPTELVQYVAAEVPDHWDDFANLYKKLTPRIMALLVQGELHVDVELVAERLAAAGCWSTWAEDARAAMLAVCNGWWESTLTSYPRQSEARNILSFLVTTPLPLTHWLDVWNAQPPGPADLHAADLCLWWAPEVMGRLTVGWSETIDITAEIKCWILGDAQPRLARVPLEPRLAECLELLADR